MSPATAPPVRLCVAPDARHVRVVRLVTVAVARMFGLGEEGLDDVRLAISEAVGRAVAAHRVNDLDSLVEVEVAIGAMLQITVHDRIALPTATGPQAAQLLQAAAEDTEMRRRAMSDADLPVLPEAVSLIEGLADESSAVTGPDGTVLTMRWRRPG